ncbi:uncharacterized protein N7503_004897 [Penicillium pulvis]|uniref:uncharacterized protein n=1 Tax=Penicillium pulvis TaxID=1562058 RepID=UPI002547DFB7|nr:uncharacterized protein N7503_004897 [Penicillium pulvis]KAJ5802447.1 hypothetical protein N7503_004897 [Penicillium pulvis]
MLLNIAAKDVVLLTLYFGHQFNIPSFWFKAVVVGIGLVLLFTVTAIITSLARAIFLPRQLVSLSDKKQEVLGKPLLFPVKFNHTRFIPVKDKFLNRFLVVGIPVGLRCRIGNLLAVDDKSLDVTPPPGATGWSWKRTFSHFSCWFTFDSARFLHRGDHGVDLREKLDSFLQSQNEDPKQWPYAYLLSVPQFLGWSRSVVSWWYLYNKDRELDTVILEINNSYWEKRNVFLRVNPTCDEPLSPPEASKLIKYLDHRQLVQSLKSAPRANFYKGIWSKYIFASPFEKVDGLVSNRMMDPLQPAAWKPNTSFSNMTTMEESGEVRMATRLTCDGPPIDPTKMSSLDVARFVFQWTIPGMLTTPEIIIKALKIKFKGMMKMNSKPPVRSGSVGRAVTPLEIKLEPFFRSYLARCVEAFPKPVKLTYLPCRSFTNDVVRMRSSSYQDNSSDTITLTVEPVDPQFYARLINYPDMMTALAHETRPTGLAADPTSQRLIVSDSALLDSIVHSASRKLLDHPSNGSHTISSWRMRLVLFWCRGHSASTFMDRFALFSSTQKSRATYVSCLLQLSSAQRLAFGSQGLLDYYTLFASFVTGWAILEGLSMLNFQFLSMEVDLSWILLIDCVGYFLVMRIFGLVKGWLLR